MGHQCGGDTRHNSSQKMSLQQSFGDILHWWHLNCFVLLVYAEKKGVHICIVPCCYLIFDVTGIRFLMGSVTLGILPWRSLAFQTARVAWSVSDTEKWTKPWKCLFLSVDCNGNLDTAQRRTSALQTSKHGQMDTAPAVVCSVEMQILLCRRSWSYVFRKKKKKK